MADNDLITKITDIVIQQTVNQKIPTVVFLSSVDKGALVKNIIWTLKGGSKDENSFTPDDWSKTAEVMQQLAEIPLIVDEIIEIAATKNKIIDFINELKTSKGLVVINSDKIKAQEFTTTENISIIGVGVNN